MQTQDNSLYCDHPQSTTRFGNLFGHTIEIRTCTKCGKKFGSLEEMRKDAAARQSHTSH